MSRPDRHRWTGCLALGPWWLLYTGAFGATAAHRHHATQVLACPMPVTVAVGCEMITAEMIVVPADVPHRIVDGSAHGTVVFIDGSVQRDTTAVAGTASSSPPDLRFDLKEMTYGHALSAADALLSSIGASTAPPRSLSTEIDGSLRLLDDDLAAPATELAARVGLSASEFSRRFSREIGLPFRSYRKWRRLLLAIEDLASGSNLTVAAHTAGFSDSAHLTRTFKAMFGIAPSDLTATSRWLAPE